MTTASDQCSHTRPLQVGIYVYENAEVLDFAAPYEAFSTASRVHARQAPDEPPPFIVSLIAETRRPVAARAGFVVQPPFSIEDHPPLDILIVAGGVHTVEMAKEHVVSWIARQHETTRLTASVCTGSFLLARAGVLAGVEATTHWEDCADLVREFPGLAVRPDQRWTERGRVMTSAGISAGLDMSLRIVARFAGEELATRTARQIDYPWRTTP
jgi:transcriptional regulator GlxA family with amidase domain